MFKRLICLILITALLVSQTGCAVTTPKQLRENFDISAKKKTPIVVITTTGQEYELNSYTIEKGYLVGKFGPADGTLRVPLHYIKTVNGTKITNPINWPLTIGCVTLSLAGIGGLAFYIIMSNAEIGY